MVKKLMTCGVFSMALAGALLAGPGSSTPFEQVAHADAFEIVCPDGSQPSCNPIFNGQGRVIGYTCICG